MPFLEEQRASLEGGGSRQTILLARRTRTMKLCSSDARSEGQSGDSLGREGVMVQRRKKEAFAQPNGMFRRANGWMGEKVAPAKHVFHRVDSLFAWQ